MKLDKKHLKKFKKDKSFVDIYTDNYNESSFGFIINFNEMFLVLDSYNDDGKADGIVIYFRENITRIRWGGNEINSVLEIANASKSVNKKAKIDLSSIQTILSSIQMNYGYVNLFIQNIDPEVCFIGEIREMDKDTIILNEYGTRISLDRKNIMINIHDITKVEVGGIYEKGLLKVYKNSSI